MDTSRHLTYYLSRLAAVICMLAVMMPCSALGTGDKDTITVNDTMDFPPVLRIFSAIKR